MDDEALLRRAERTLAEIKVAQGLSDRHASVLAALRIRLKGDPGKKLEDLLSTAGDLGGPQLEEMLSEEPPKPSRSLDDVLGGAEKPKRSLDDVFSEGSKPKPEWPGGSDPG